MRDVGSVLTRLGIVAVIVAPHVAAAAWRAAVHRDLAIALKAFEAGDAVRVAVAVAFAGSTLVARRAPDAPLVDH